MMMRDFYFSSFQCLCFKNKIEALNDYITNEKFFCNKYEQHDIAFQLMPLNSNKNDVGLWGKGLP